MWFELLDQNFEDIVDGEQILYGAYIVIAAGCVIIIVAAIGIFGASCSCSLNKFLLVVVSFEESSLKNLLPFMSYSALS